MFCFIFVWRGTPIYTLTIFPSEICVRTCMRSAFIRYWSRRIFMMKSKLDKAVALNKCVILVVCIRYRQKVAFLYMNVCFLSVRHLIEINIKYSILLLSLRIGLLSAFYCLSDTGFGTSAVSCRPVVIYANRRVFY